MDFLALQLIDLAVFSNERIFLYSNIMKNVVKRNKNTELFKVNDTIFMQTKKSI